LEGEKGKNGEYVEKKVIGILGSNFNKDKHLDVRYMCFFDKLVFIYPTR
jgi:hypothetical protein